MANKVYGMTPSGEITECRAQRPETCRYHVKGSHRSDLTESQVSVMNQAHFQAINQQKAMKKTSSGNGNTSEQLKQAFMNGTPQEVYEKAVDANAKMESDNRFPVSVNSMLPAVSNGNRNDVIDSELKFLQNKDTTNLAGHTLIGNEEEEISNRIKEYANRNINRTSSNGRFDEPTPAEERAAMTFASNPNVSHDKAMELAKDRNVVAFMGSKLVSSPYITDDVKEQVWKTNERTALESQSLSGKYVNESLRSKANV